jgi:hypothetical protein
MDFKSGSISAQYPPTLIRIDKKVVGRGGRKISIKNFVAVDNDTVTIDITNMTYESGQWNAQMTFNMNKKESNFKYGTSSQYCGLFGCGD